MLRSGGAHLDFRTRDGITALHRAVLCRNSTSLTVRALVHCGNFLPRLTYILRALVERLRLDLMVRWRSNKQRSLLVIHAVRRTLIYNENMFH